MQIVENKMLHNIDLSLSGSQSLKIFTVVIIQLRNDQNLTFVLSKFDWHDLSLIFCHNASAWPKSV